MSDEERERFLNDAADRFARLFLNQVLWERQQKNKKKDD